MVSMKAGMLDHRNIGSNISFDMEADGVAGTISGALAVVVQMEDKTEIVLAHDDESIIVEKDTAIEVALPPAAAYTLALKQAIESLIAGKTLIETFPRPMQIVC